MRHFFGQLGQTQPYYSRVAHSQLRALHNIHNGDVGLLELCGGLQYILKKYIIHNTALFKVSGGVARYCYSAVLYQWLRLGFDPFAYLTTLEETGIIPVPGKLLKKRSDARIKPLP